MSPNFGVDDLLSRLLCLDRMVLVEDCDPREDSLGMVLGVDLGVVFGVQGRDPSRLSRLPDRCTRGFVAASERVLSRLTLFLGLPQFSEEKRKEELNQTEFQIKH